MLNYFIIVVSTHEFKSLNSSVSRHFLESTTAHLCDDQLIFEDYMWYLPFFEEIFIISHCLGVILGDQLCYDDYIWWSAIFWQLYVVISWFVWLLLWSATFGVLYMVICHCCRVIWDDQLLLLGSDHPLFETYM